MIEENVTPMLSQYLGIKKDLTDCLLFFRLGDFYELFFDDAKTVHNKLGLTLTKRGRIQGQEIPMCGVPVISVQHYISRLVNMGFKIAICDQIEPPSKKGIVNRQVTRIVTKGTLTEDALLKNNEANFLLSVANSGENKFALAYTDVSQGKVWFEQVNEKDLDSAIFRIAPTEIIIDQVIERLNEWDDCLVKAPNLQVEFPDNWLIQNYQTGILKALKQLLSYLFYTQNSHLPYLESPVNWLNNRYLGLDNATLRNLEILQNNQNFEQKNSLLQVLDFTKTGPGARTLRHFLTNPLLDDIWINKRLDVVEFLLQNSGSKTMLEKKLNHVFDLRRILARVSLNRSNPKDLRCLVTTLELTIEKTNYPDLLQKLVEDINTRPQVLEILQAAINLQEDDSNWLIRTGYNKELDELRKLENGGLDKILQLQEIYVKETGINTLKIKHNNIIGYHVNIPPTGNNRVPDKFIHRQTLVNAVRYTTKELLDLEVEITEATTKAAELEKVLLNDLSKIIIKEIQHLYQTADAWAEIDTFCSLASAASHHGFCRPVVDKSFIFDIKDGRHPIIENANPQINFIRNDCTLTGNARLWLMTGPNMAGKSTFLRQNALMVIMAQMGSFVPAETAHIGIVDRLFTRIGASDSLVQGQSTFMLEMLETAFILKNATAGSFVILDEIGRGTSTHDGLAIAEAVLDHLYTEIGCRGLFATHYRELTKYPIPCYTLKTDEVDGKIKFFHKVIMGVAAQSFGINVAALAGLPKQVIKKAQKNLIELSKNEF